MRYPGGKGRSYPHLLNLMPPHRVYIETHLGGGAVMRNKLPAQRQIGIDFDDRVIREWAAQDSAPCELVCSDAVDYLQQVPPDPDALVYCDPPYFPATRRRARVYRYDYSEADHVRLLECLTGLDCSVMVSGYDNPLYAEALAGWRHIQFDAMTHTGIRRESVWVNYDHSGRLHDCHHLGSNFREREANRRRRTRLYAKVRSLSLPEQHGLLEWLRKMLEEAA